MDCEWKPPHPHYYQHRIASACTYCTGKLCAQVRLQFMTLHLWFRKITQLESSPTAKIFFNVLFIYYSHTCPSLSHNHHYIGLPQPIRLGFAFRAHACLLHSLWTGSYPLGRPNFPLFLRFSLRLTLHTKTLYTLRFSYCCQIKLNLIKLLY